MLYPATANLLIAVLLGCPFLCLGESAGTPFVRAMGDVCARDAGDACHHEMASNGDVLRDAGCDDEPCDHDDCPEPDCICAGALTAVADDSVAEDGECVVWLNFAVDAQSTAAGGFPIVIRDRPYGLSAPSTQRRCAQLGRFLL